MVTEIGSTKHMLTHTHTHTHTYRNETNIDTIDQHTHANTYTHTRADIK